METRYPDPLQVTVLNRRISTSSESSDEEAKQRRSSIPAGAVPTAIVGNEHAKKSVASEQTEVKHHKYREVSVDVTAPPMVAQKPSLPAIHTLYFLEMGEPMPPASPRSRSSHDSCSDGEHAGTYDVNPQRPAAVAKPTAPPPPKPFENGTPVRASAILKEAVKNTKVESID